MASVIKLKRSLTPGSVPNSLEAGELAINIPDKKLFSSNGSSVFSVSGDTYNLTSSVGNGGATITLTVDNEALSNDAITFLGGTGISVSRNANDTIVIAATGESSATSLANARDFQLSGDITSSAVSFDGTQNVTLNGTIAAGAVTNDKIADGTITSTKIASGGITANAIANDSVALGTKTTGNYVASVANSTGRVVVSGSGEGAAVTIDVPLATSSAPGVAQFSTDNFAIAGGVVTIKNNGVILGTETTGNYVATVTGTSNEIVISGSGSETAAVTVGLADNVTIPNNLTVTGNTSLGGNLSVDGDLTVNGTLTYINSTTVTIGDNMLKLANTNSADTADTGFYSLYNDGGNKFTGLVRDATDGAYYLFDGLSTEPDQQINFGNASIATLNAVIDGGTY